MHMQKIKLEGQLIQKLEWQRTDGRTDTNDSITFLANASATSVQSDLAKVAWLLHYIITITALTAKRSAFYCIYGQNVLMRNCNFCLSMQTTVTVSDPFGSDDVESIFGHIVQHRHQAEHKPHKQS